MVKLKLLRNQTWYQSVHTPQYNSDGQQGPPKRTSTPIKAQAGDIRDFDKVDAEKYVMAQNALPVDQNGDITQAAINSLGRHEKREMWGDLLYPITDVERQRLRSCYSPPVQGTPLLDAMLGGEPAPKTPQEAYAENVEKHGAKSDEEAAANLKKIVDKVAGKSEVAPPELTEKLTDAALSAAEELLKPRKRRTQAEMKADGDKPRKRRRGKNK